MSRPFLLSAVLGLSLLCLAVAAPTTPPTHRPAASPALGRDVRATPPAGPLLGRESNGLRTWLGIRYAQPPTGDARWQPPRPLPSQTAERRATQPGSVCLQAFAIPGQAQTVRGAEDCLFLNVYAPANAKKAPVMVWIHGGSFQTGAGTDYDLSLLAREQGVVAVSLNYRLGPLGFLATPGEDGLPGNLGLLDQQLALKWVRDNISAFGGDPSRVTVFGESAGGMSICAQLAAPGAKGLFQRAIIQSGSCTAPTITLTQAEAQDLGRRFMASLDCRDVACLRALPGEKLARAPSPNALFPGAIPFPVLHGDAVLPREPGEFLRQGLGARVPVLIGTNQHEGTLFAAWLGDPRRDLNPAEFLALNVALNGPDALRATATYTPRNYGSLTQAAAAVATDSLFACPASNLARDLSRFVPVYRYEFRDPNPPRPAPLRPTAGLPRFGSFHGAEIASVMGTRTDLGDPAQFTPAQQTLARTIRTYWANFARTGNPNGPGLPAWPALRVGQPPQVLGLAPGAGQIALVRDFRGEHHCDTVWRP